MPDLGDASSPHVAIVVDHPQRDLPGIVLTAIELARRGVVCRLVPFNLQEREIWAFEPDFVLFNFLRRSNERFGRELHEAGIALGVLDTEGAIWPDPDEYVSLLWKDTALLREVRCVCMWGPLLAEHLVTRGIFTREQVAITGCPRFDLYARPWRDLNEDAAEALRRHTRTILINTNFSISNPRFTTRDKCVAMHRTVLGYSEDDVSRMVEAEDIAIRETVRLAEKLAEKYSTVDVVIRPHPFENPAPYEAVAAARPNVRVNDGESIQAAIFSACAVIQRSCTTALEAGLAGVATFSPQWIPAPMLMPAAEAVSVPCSSFSELTAHLSAILGGSYRTSEATRQAIADVVHDCCFAADGLSHRRVTAVVFGALGSSRRVDSDRCRRALYGLDSANGHPLARAARYLRHGLQLPPEWSFTQLREVPAIDWTRSRKHFDVTRVQAIVDRAQQCGTSTAPAAAVDGVVVSAANGTADGWRAHARYSVTIAPRWRPQVSAGVQHRVTSTTDVQVVSR